MLPQTCCFAYYIEAPPDQFLCLLYGGLSGHFFSRYNICLPQIGFFTYYVSFLFGGPLKSVFSLTMWMPPSGQFFLLTMCGPSKSVSLHTMGLLRSVSSHTIWGPPQTCLFAYYIGPPSDQFFRLLYETPVISVNLLTIFEVLIGQFLCLLFRASIGQFLCLLLPPPPQGRCHDLEGGSKNCFLIFVNQHVAKPYALLRGFGGMPPNNFFLNGTIWFVLVCILIQFCL